MKMDRFAQHYWLWEDEKKVAKVSIQFPRDLTKSEKMLVGSAQCVVTRKEEFD